MFDLEKEMQFELTAKSANLLKPLSHIEFSNANGLLKPANEPVLSSPLAEISKPLADTKSSDYKGISRLAGLADTNAAKKIITDPLRELQESQEIELIPDDFRYLDSLLFGRSLAVKTKLLEQYKCLWIGVSKGERLKPHEAQNAGRFAANTWIREQLCK